MPTVILQPKELLRAQLDAAVMCDQTVSIQHIAAAPGVWGEAVQTPGAAITSAAIIDAPSDEDMRVYGPKIGERFAWNIKVPMAAVGGPTLAVGDQITLPNGIVCTAVGPDLIKSYPFLNEFLAVAVR